jgi:hypothetical protein
MYGNQFASSSYSSFSQHLQQQLLEQLAQILLRNIFSERELHFFFPFNNIVVEQ